MKAIIDRASWEMIKKEAINNFPNECVGFFIGFRFILEEAKIDIGDVFPCKNISKEKTTGSVVSLRAMKKVAKECTRRNKQFGHWLVGQFHSHPTTGSTAQSDLDQVAGRRWKEYRIQIILGLKNKKTVSIRRKLYYYDRIKKVWQEGKIIVGK